MVDAKIIIEPRTEHAKNVTETNWCPRFIAAINCTVLSGGASTLCYRGMSDEDLRR